MVHPLQVSAEDLVHSQAGGVDVAHSLQRDLVSPLQAGGVDVVHPLHAGKGTGETS